MQYLGGKCAIAGSIADILNRYAPARYLEPFLGGCNILPLINAPERVGADAHAPLISLYRALQRGWVPPANVSEEEFLAVKANPDPTNPRTAFIQFGCSFSGVLGGGYARNAIGHNYALSARNSLMAKFSRVRGTDVFIESDFRRWVDVTDYLIYCDPPYLSTLGFRNFPYDEFWPWVRTIAKKNTVIVSEYVAPPDFVTLLSIPTLTSVNSKTIGCLPRYEKLFIHESQPPPPLFGIGEIL